MNLDARTRLIENALVSAAIGMLVFLTAGFGLVADSSTSAAEVQSLGDATGATGIALAATVNDPAFTRLYSLRNASDPAFGTVLTLRKTGASANFALLLNTQGSLIKAVALDSFPDSRIKDDRSLLDSYPSADQALTRLAQSVRSAAQTAKGE